MRNKANGFYWAEYICLNCRKEKLIQIEFGKPIPTLSTSEFAINNSYSNAINAPECDYCGCKSWSHGKYSD